MSVRRMTRQALILLGGIAALVAVLLLRGCQVSRVSELDSGETVEVGRAAVPNQVQRSVADSPSARELVGEPASAGYEDPDGAVVLCAVYPDLTPAAGARVSINEGGGDWRACGVVDDNGVKAISKLPLGKAFSVRMVTAEASGEVWVVVDSLRRSRRVNCLLHRRKERAVYVEDANGRAVRGAVIYRNSASGHKPVGRTNAEGACSCHLERGAWVWAVGDGLVTEQRRVGVESEIVLVAAVGGVVGGVVVDVDGDVVPGVRVRIGLEGGVPASVSQRADIDRWQRRGARGDLPRFGGRSSYAAMVAAR